MPTFVRTGVRAGWIRLRACIRALTWVWLAACMPALAQVLEANQASAAQLVTLSGVGPVLAQRIVQARQHRPFSGWDDLQARVAGVGPKTAEKLSAQGLRVNGRSYGTELAQAAAAGRGANLAPSAPPQPPAPPTAQPLGAASHQRAAGRPSAPPAAYPVIPGLSAPTR